MITKRDFILRGSCFCEKYKYLVIKSPSHIISDFIPCVSVSDCSVAEVQRVLNVSDLVSLSTSSQRFPGIDTTPTTPLTQNKDRSRLTRLS